jgi:transketolase
VADGTDCVLIATGSEVSAAVAARDLLAAKNISARVVSMPSWELFDEQDEDYMDSVLPEGQPKLAMEAASTLGWERWADAVIGIDTFGASAPGPELMEQYGITAEAMAEIAATIFEDDE